MVKHNLVESEYNLRRSSCESVVSKLSIKLGRELKTLRDLNLPELETNQTHLTDLEFKRAKYVLEENVRVEEMITA